MRIVNIILMMLFFYTSAQAAFVEGLEDFPIPDGLEQIEDAGLNFGNEDIRLVETYMKSTTLKFADVCNFYKSTLPQLGWKLIKHSPNRIVFERESEIVELKKETDKPLIVNLLLKSKTK